MGYELLVRRTTAPTYTRIVDVGDRTSFLLDEQLDDVWVGVRAVGADGSLAGYAGGLERKRWLLAHEGAAPPPRP